MDNWVWMEEEEGSYTIGFALIGSQGEKNTSIFKSFWSVNVIPKD